MRVYIHIISKSKYAEKNQKLIAIFGKDRFIHESSGS